MPDDPLVGRISPVMYYLYDYVPGNPQMSVSDDPSVRYTSPIMFRITPPRVDAPRPLAGVSSQMG